MVSYRTGLGPKGKPFIGNLGEIKKDPLGFFSKASREYGDVVRIWIGLDTIYLINHPDHLKHIFQENRDNYVRSKYYRELAPILGQGLFTLEGKAWRKQRAVSQPAVKGLNLVGMVDEMVSSAQEMIQRWRAYERKGATVDVTAEASRLTLDIVMRSLFSTKLDPKDFDIVFSSLSEILREVEKRIWEAFPTPIFFPTPRNRKLKREIGKLNKIIYSLVDDRIQNGNKKKDLLDLILEAEKEDWGPKSRKSIRDQVISIVLAGHETGANALSWLFFEISKNPEIGRKIRREANQVFGDRSPTFESFQNLKFTSRVFQEVLRLYPPAWTMSRVALGQDQLGLDVIPKGATVMLCPYTIHRHPKLWNNPEKFDPDRFLPEHVAKRHPFSYFPFGGGPHYCLGSRFASIEGVLTLAALCMSFDFNLCSGQRLEPSPMTTLRPKDPVLVKLKMAEEKTPLAA